MSGSDWTTDTLHAHIIALLGEKDLRDDQRFQAQQQALRDALDKAEQAVDKANTATEKRFDSVNEFRGQLSDQAATFMQRSEALALITGVKEQLTRNEERSQERLNLLSNSDRFSAGRMVGSDNLSKLIFAAIGAAGVLYAIVNH